MKFQTKLIHANKKHNEYGAVSDPIYRADTFKLDNVKNFSWEKMANQEAFAYTRAGNPTLSALENRISALENAEDTVVAASGMGAISSFLLTFLKKGDHILADTTLYDGTFNLITKTLVKFGIEVTILDLTKYDEIYSKLKPNTKIVYCEVPSNPTMKIIDIKKVSSIVHGFNKNIKVAVDSTFASSFLLNPLTLGANFVLHSLTKYMNGHSDVLGGSVSGKKKDMDLIRVEGIMYNTGAVLSPDNAILILRGLKTLALRVEKASNSALKIAKYLEKLPFVTAVHYPGLTSNSYHNVAKKQMKMYTGMLSFTTKFNVKQTIEFINGVKLFARATSLGGVESLIEMPAVGVCDKENLKLMNIEQNLIRLSIGIEDTNDLIEDLNQAFNLAKKK